MARHRRHIKVSRFYFGRTMIVVPHSKHARRLLRRLRRRRRERARRKRRRRLWRKRHPVQAFFRSLPKHVLDAKAEHVAIPNTGKERIATKRALPQADLSHIHASEKQNQMQF